MEHQCDITDEFEKLSISPEEKHSDNAHIMSLLFNPNRLCVLPPLPRLGKFCFMTF